MTENDMVDIWREANPELFQFTWKQNHPSLQERLDFFIASEALLGLVKIQAFFLLSFRPFSPLIRSL